MSAASPIQFASLRIDRSGGGVFRLDATGSAVPVAIGSRALDVLCALAAHPGEVVSKRQIMDAVWPDMAVQEKNLTMQVSALRQVLEREGGRGWIQTIPGRGYRLVAPLGGTDAQDGPLAPIDAAPAHPAATPTRVSWWFAVVLMLVAIVAGAAGLLVGGAGSARWLSQFGFTAPVAVPALPRPVAYSPQDRRQSVIVLPFENSSGDAVQDAVAAGFTRDLTDAIAGDPAIPTVPFATAASYRGKPIDLHAIMREHDVHFALTGNVRRQDGRLIVAATLFETADARQIWSQHYDRPDSPEAWQLILRQVDGNCDQATMEAEIARAMREHPDSLDKRDLVFAMRVTSLSQVSRVNLLTQIALLERALALDPDYVVALRENARKHAQLVLGGFSSDRDADLAIASKSVERALQLKPDDYWTLREKAVVLYAQRNYNEAAALLRRLIERKPLAAFRHLLLGQIMVIQGHHKEALESFTTARRLAVGTDSVNALDANVAVGLLANGRFPEAIEQARLAITEYPPESGREGEVPWLVLIAAESGNGQEAEARADLKKFLATPRTLRSMSELVKFPFHAANPILLNGLLQAGMPEE